MKLPNLWQDFLHILYLLDAASSMYVGTGKGCVCASPSNIPSDAQKGVVRHLFVLSPSRRCAVRDAFLPELSSSLSAVSWTNKKQGL